MASKSSTKSTQKTSSSTFDQQQDGWRALGRPAQSRRGRPSTEGIPRYDLKKMSVNGAYEAAADRDRRMLTPPTEDPLDVIRELAT